MPQIQATVNRRLLSKASRLFTGTLEGRITEILQNARRAGATEVAISNQDGRVNVRDNGRGISDFARLLDLGGSDWQEAFEDSEDPAGVGLFSLAPRELTIRSNGSITTITRGGWTGAPVDVKPDSDPAPGTFLTFEDEPWNRQVVEPLAVFTGMQVSVDGEACVMQSFVGPDAVHLPEFGCRIEVRSGLTGWRRAQGRGSYDWNALVNFHGQQVGFAHHPVDESALRYLVDLTGEPTGIRLLLPARTQVVENETFEQLKQAIELEAYRYIQRRGEHRLPYKQFVRARALGIELPEATPTYSVGLLREDCGPAPVEAPLPEGFPLAKCYRFSPDNHGDREDADLVNAHLLAALGALDEPFVPVAIASRYDGYSWSKLPAIESVDLEVGRTLRSDYVWSGRLTCVESPRVTVRTSDGKTFSSPVCMAKPIPPADGEDWDEDEMLVTPEAQTRLLASHVWYHLGGWSEDGDTYDTQEFQFEQELDRFWAELMGPDERLRRRVLEALLPVQPEWRSVEVESSGQVRIHLADGSTKVIAPAESPA